jgi:hypothetical protein
MLARRVNSLSPPIPEPSAKKSMNRGSSLLIVIFHCQLTPTRSPTQAYFLLNGYIRSGIKTLPSAAKSDFCWGGAD